MSDSQDDPESTGLARRRAGGRPRSAALDAAILAATVRLLGDVGPVRLSMERIAHEVGCSRTSLYRRWPSVEALTIAAMGQSLSGPELTGSGERGLAAVVQNRMEVAVDRAAILALAVIIGETVRETELGRRYLDDVFWPSRQARMRWLAEAVAAGLVRSDVDAELLLDAVSGTLLYRAIFGNRLDGALPANLLELLTEGARPR